MGKKALNLSYVGPVSLSNQLTKIVEQWEWKDSLRLPLCEVELSQASMARIPHFLRGVGCRPSDYLMSKRLLAVRTGGSRYSDP